MSVDGVAEGVQRRMSCGLSIMTPADAFAPETELECDIRARAESEDDEVARLGDRLGLDPLQR